MALTFLDHLNYHYHLNNLNFNNFLIMFRCNEKKNKKINKKILLLFWLKKGIESLFNLKIINKKKNDYLIHFFNALPNIMILTII